MFESLANRQTNAPMRHLHILTAAHKICRKTIIVDFQQIVYKQNTFLRFLSVFKAIHFID